MAEITTVSIDDIREPTQSEQLHPETDQQRDQNWEDFRRSIGDDPAELPSVLENGDGYELITGHRRLRALKQNGVEEVDVRVRELRGDEKYIERLAENHHRQPSDPLRQAEYTAQYVAPWLVLPGDRWEEIETIWTNGSFAERVGLKGGGSSVSNWLRPLKDNRALREVLGDIGNSSVSGKIGWDEIETIDSIVDCFEERVTTGEMSWFCTELAELGSQVSLGEIEQVGEMAKEEKWGTDRILEELNELVPEADPVPGEVEHGPMVGDDPFEDTSTSRPKDADRGQSVDSVPEADQERTDSFEFGISQPDIDWDELITDDDIVDEEYGSVGKIKRMRMEGGLPAIEDDAAVTMNFIAAVTGRSKEDVWREFFQPVMVEHGVAFLSEFVEET